MLGVAYIIGGFVGIAISHYIGAVPALGGCLAGGLLIIVMQTKKVSR